MDRIGLVRVAAIRFAARFDEKVGNPDGHDLQALQGLNNYQIITNNIILKSV